jgi:hypothetical protein
MCVNVYYTYVVVPVVSVEIRIMYVCVCVFYTLVSAPGDPSRSYRENLKLWFPLHVYHLRICENEDSIIVFPAIWSRSVEL